MALLSTKFWLIGLHTGSIAPVPVIFMPEIISTRNLKPKATSGRDLKPLVSSAIAPAPTPVPLSPTPDIVSTGDLKPRAVTTRDLHPIIEDVDED
jgi:hypothetical protein